MEEALVDTFQKAILMLFLMMVAVNIGHLSKRWKFEFIGESGIFMLMGKEVGAGKSNLILGYESQTNDFSLKN